MEKQARQYLEVLSEEEVQEIHRASLEILENVGIVALCDEALDVFRKHGARVDGNRVYVPAKLAEESLKETISSFEVRSRNPLHNVVVGGGEPVCTPAAGPVYIVDGAGGRRKSLSSDSINVVKLTQTSDVLHMNAGISVIPNDIPAPAMYLFMALVTALYSDKPLAGFANGTKVAQESIEFAARIMGNDSYNQIATINPTSPLIYDTNQLEGLLVYARARQPLCIASCGMAGSTTPTTLAATLAVTNAEVLFGVILSQLVSPGTPVIYGNTSSITDMRNVTFSIGAPELSLLLAASAQMARFYGLPYRGGGSLTDAKITDFQAGYESMLSLFTTYLCGTDFMFHATGILDSFLSFSYEKFIVDEEIGRMVRRFMHGFKVNGDTLAYDLVLSAGPGGQFLSHPHTARNFRKEFFQPQVSNRQNFTQWENSGAGNAAKLTEAWQKRLAEYTMPDMEKGLKRELVRYFEDRYGTLRGIPRGDLE